VGWVFGVFWVGGVGGGWGELVVGVCVWWGFWGLLWVFWGGGLWGGGGFGGGGISWFWGFSVSVLCAYWDYSKKRGAGRAAQKPLFGRDGKTKREGRESRQTNVGGGDLDGSYSPRALGGWWKREIKRERMASAGTSQKKRGQRGTKSGSHT